MRQAQGPRQITAIIPCFNEEKTLPAAIESVSWADEIIVIDSFSTDQSPVIAQNMGARLIQHEYENSAAQKNRCIPMATYEWVFILDADETVTAALKHEILSMMKAAEEPKAQAFWIGRNNQFMGRPIRYSGWQGDRVIRLFKRDQCRYEQKRVHAEIICEGEVSSLHNRLDHNTYKGIQHYLDKLHRYAQWQAEDLFQQGKRVSAFKAVYKAGFRFFKHYCLQRGYKDGFPGLVISVLQSYAVFMRYVKLWLLHRGLQ
jgi:glycosyltransferase involved in cell wall biosynthesis